MVETTSGKRYSIPSFSFFFLFFFFFFYFSFTQSVRMPFTVGYFDFLDTYTFSYARFYPQLILPSTIERENEGIVEQDGYHRQQKTAVHFLNFHILRLLWGQSASHSTWSPGPYQRIVTQPRPSPLLVYFVVEHNTRWVLSSTQLLTILYLCGFMIL